jgi:hypothetical protein
VEIGVDDDLRQGGWVCRHGLGVLGICGRAASRCGVLGDDRRQGGVEVWSLSCAEDLWHEGMKLWRL